MLTDICVELDFPPEAVAYFAFLNHQIEAQTPLSALMEAAKRDYLDGGSEHLVLLMDAANSVEASQYSVCWRLW